MDWELYETAFWAKCGETDADCQYDRDELVEWFDEVEEAGTTITGLSRPLGDLGTDVGLELLHEIDSGNQAVRVWELRHGVMIETTVGTLQFLTDAELEGLAGDAPEPVDENA